MGRAATSSMFPQSSPRIDATNRVDPNHGLSSEELAVWDGTVAPCVQENIRGALAANDAGNAAAVGAVAGALVGVAAGAAAANRPTTVYVVPVKHCNFWGCR